MRSAKYDSRISDSCISTAISTAIATTTAVWIIIAVYQQRTAKQLHFRHSRTSDGCLPTATSEAAAPYDTPVSEIAEYQQRLATVNSDQCSNSNYDSRVIKSCISTGTSRTAVANLTSLSAISLKTVYQKRSAKQMHLWHSHGSDGCIPTATSEAAATMTLPCQQL